MKNEGCPKVLLFPDTSNNYFAPRTARAAVEVLEDAGYQVVVPKEHVCCGRPLYDHGFLGDARKYLLHAMAILTPYVEQHIPIIVLEPSCWSVFHDEIRNLFPEREETRKIMESTFLLADFLSQRSAYSPPPLKMEALMHAHCHCKAIDRGADYGRTLLEKMQLQVRPLIDGCCGMAGAFGFMDENYDVSVTIAEHALLPAVRAAKANELIVADGFSCREQIAQLTDRRALHTAEVLQLALQATSARQDERPESALERQDERALRRSRVRTMAVLGGLTLGAIAFALLKRNNSGN